MDVFLILLLCVLPAPLVACYCPLWFTIAATAAAAISAFTPWGAAQHGRNMVSWGLCWWFSILGACSLVFLGLVKLMGVL